MPQHKGQTGRSGGQRCGALLIVFVVLAVLNPACISPDTRRILRISDWETGEVYVEYPVSPGDELFFGWIHSLDKIPWNEYYHIDEDSNLILDTISFTAFGAGIPHDRGKVCYIKDGVIYMSEINEIFTEFVWINSPTATQEIRVAGEYVTRGSELPHNRRLVLKVTRRNSFGK